MLRRFAIAIATALLAAPSAFAQPRFGNPSPTAGSETSQKGNAGADTAAFKPVEYKNKDKKGPALVVLPGEVKSSHATFTQKFGPNNIPDYAELELSQANFPVLERANLGALLNEMSLAYNLGDAQKAKQMMQQGKLKTTRWITKFDILKAEQIAENRQGFDGRAVGGVIGALGGVGARVTGRAAGTVQNSEAAAVWLVGLRYKILDAVTTEQVAQGYSEVKMEIGAQSSSVMGSSQSAKGGVGLDTMVQRLVQLAVWEIDSKYK